MRAVVQRVTRAEVRSRPDGDSDYVSTGQIRSGACVLVGVTHDDGEGEVDKMARKLVGLRIFADDDGVMNLAAHDVGAEFLVVSQFTLHGDTSKGRRPSWVAAARPEHAEPLVDRLVEQLRATGVRVETGRFRTDMQVELVNDGPVTLIVET